MWKVELTNVTINDWRRLEDTLGTWERVTPVWNRKSEHQNEPNSENGGENSPDNGRDFPFGGRWRVYIII
jgi:hypothetical protein